MPTTIIRIHVSLLRVTKIVFRPAIFSLDITMVLSPSNASVEVTIVKWNIWVVTPGLLVAGLVFGLFDK